MAVLLFRKVVPKAAFLFVNLNIPGKKCKSNEASRLKIISTAHSFLMEVFC